MCDRVLKNPERERLRERERERKDCELTALDMNGACAILPPKIILCHTRVVPRVLELGIVDLDPGVSPV